MTKRENDGKDLKRFDRRCDRAGDGSAREDDLATLKDIGEELGLSPATVSRALNGFPEVSAKTRARVKQTAERLNYTPNRIAQKLVTGRSGMVGMIVRLSPDMSSDRSFLEIMLGLSSHLAEADIDLVFQVAQDDDPVAPYRRLVENNTLDGFILNAPVRDDPRIAFLLDHGIAFVVHGCADDDAAYAFFDVDNHALAARSVSFLADLGHRRIGHINGEAHHAYAVERDRGFAAAAKARGLTVPADFKAHGEPSESYGYMTALDMLTGRSGPSPTALVCASTVTAAGVYRAAGDKGLAIPGDLSVIAHDDALPAVRAVSFTPQLTVSRAPFRDACAPLSAKLIALLGGARPQDQQTTVDADFIVRGSTGPAPVSGRRLQEADHG